MRSSDRQAGSGSHAARVSFICTANRARSPFAAALLRRHLDGLHVAVESFGILEHGGAPALPGAVRAAWAFGIDLTEHRARPLGAGELAGTELAIGFEPFHVASAVVTGGVATARAFLLAELADALEDDIVPWPADAQHLDERVTLADARRRVSDRLPRSIADPVGGSELRFQHAYHEIDRLVAIVAMRLFSASDDRMG